MDDRSRSRGSKGRGFKHGSATYLPLSHKYDVDKQLCEYASKNADAIRPPGQLSPDQSRTEYERDYHRILFSLAFRRLRHKTQVFYAPRNDHICSRMEHSLQVASISDTVCRNLRLNMDLAMAIALGHDLGHAPFGHTDEEALEELCQTERLEPFTHEAHSLRIVDTMRELHGEQLKLTYQVRDGIVCHCGEQYDRILEPDKTKDIKAVDATAARKQKPYTMEGCVVRYVDRIAYLPVDLQDALELGIVRQQQIPKNVARMFGRDSGEMIGRITDDLITSSLGKPYIHTSVAIFDCICELYNFSKQHIYTCRHLAKQKERAKKVIAELFHEFRRIFEDTDRGQDKGRRRNHEGEAYRIFFEFVDTMQYDEHTPAAQVSLDYVAGMTDNFALNSYQEIFLSIPMPY